MTHGHRAHLIMLWCRACIMPLIESCVSLRNLDLIRVDNYYFNRLIKDKLIKLIHQY